KIEVRFSATGWVDDQLAFEYSMDNWATSATLALYSATNPTNPPPAALTTVSFSGLEGIINAPAVANAVQGRFRGVAKAGSGTPDTITLSVDQVRLVLDGMGPEPAASPTATATPS